MSKVKIKRVDKTQDSNKNKQRLTASVVSYKGASMQTINRQPDTNVGTKFLSISNSDLADVFSASTGSKAFASSQKRFYGLAKMPDYAENIPELGGVIVPQLLLRNDNTGSKAMLVGVGLFRLVCSNGLMLSFGDAFTAKVRHIDGPKAHGILDRLPGIIEAQMERIKSGQVFDDALEAAGQSVKDPFQVVGSLPIQKSVKDFIIRKIGMGYVRPEDDVNTVWGLYNVVNEATRNHSSRMDIALDKDIGLLGHIQLLAA